MFAVETELPDLKSSYRLTSETCARYRRDGHVVLRGLCPRGEIEAFREPIARAAAESTLNLWRKDDDVARFTLARRFAKAAAELMGVDAVRIYHDRAVVDEPGDGHTPWHQDQLDIPLDTPNVVTMWVPLVDVPADAGSLDFVSASHRDGVAASETDESAIAKRKLPVSHCGALSAGDAVFYAGWTLHRAAANAGEHAREAMTVTYFADGARVADCTRVRRAQELKSWLPGQRPGELAGTHLNPVVYRRRHFDPAD